MIEKKGENLGLFDSLAKQFSKTSSDHIGQAVEEMVGNAIARRKGHERRWYDNNFFDDGYHFRVISRKTGQVIDHTEGRNSYVERAIPRASRQIRGVSNLLFTAEPFPVVYPERITAESFRNPQTQQVDVEALQKAMDQAKSTARRQGNWLTTEWDDMQLPIKLIDMILLAAKNSVSWVQIYSDTDKQKILTDVYDAFEVVCFGDRREPKDLPFITKTSPMDLPDILKDPRFDPKMVARLTPDNRYATSEIKEAYMRSRYGAKNADKKTGSIIVKETFLKEVLTDDNWKDAIELSKDTAAMEGKSKGDIIMRHPFSAAGVTLFDEYVDYDEYPLVPFRFEPGPIYQVPFIERFIPQNKSLDVIVTRLEKWINAMIVGVYQQRKGENMQLSNFPGGQIMQYETTPLTQMQTGTVGNTPFNVIEMLNKFIDEQGATTAGGIDTPQGIKSGVAIESIKATEYANLKITTLMLKQTIKNIAEQMLERADKDFLEPKEVSSMEDGEPDYFDVIGQKGMDLSKKVNKPLPPGIVPLKKGTKVRIEIEPGMGMTMDGKKEAMQQIIKFMIEMSTPPPAGPGIIPPDALKMVVKRFMEVFGYGNTQEFMESMDQAPANNIDDDQLKKMQIAMLTALKDSGAVGPEAQKMMVDSTKVGVLESLKESGLMDKMNKPEPIQGPKPVSETLSYKDAPEDIKRQIEAQAGLQPSQGISPAGSDQLAKHVETVKSSQTPIVDQNAQHQAEIAVKEKAVNMKSFPISKFRKNVK